MADQTEGSASLRDVKLLILGNGRAGKTQIVNRLAGQEFNPAWDSTHGVRITATVLPGDSPIPLHMWDFGGQDIYHGTHALFAQSAGLFLVVWAEDTENIGSYQHKGITFRNHPLAYWLAQSSHYAQKINPIVMVQTKCDRPEEERAPPVEQLLLTKLPYGRVRHISTRVPRGLEALKETLCDAIDWHRRSERGGEPLIGLGRLAVRRRIEAIRDSDSRLPVEERRYRWITSATFGAWCAEDGRISDPDAFLRYLHNAGVVFHREGMFDNRIIIDQQWALDAVYAVFNRELSYRPIRAQGGRFTRRLLAELIWQDYGEAEQELLLSMMRTCGICFRHREASQDADAEYIAPDLLPPRERMADALRERWDGAGGAIHERRFAFQLLHGALLRAVTCRIGEQATVNGLYWQGGVYAYDRTSSSRALIEHVDGADEVVLRVRGGADELLLERLTNWIEEEASRLGLPIPERPRKSMTIEATDRERTPAIPIFAPTPRHQRSFFVSYAWGSDALGATDIDRQRGEVVDRLFEEAQKRGIDLQRDRDQLGFGDRISTFMDAMIEADRIAVILSSKYLRSPWCMTELCGIWEWSRRRERDFLKRVRVYVLPDATLSTVTDRLKIAAYWQAQYKEIKNLVDEHGHEILGERDHKQYRQIAKFRDNVSDILATISDTVRPVGEDDFHKWTLDDIFSNDE